MSIGSGTAKALRSDCLNLIYSIRRQFQGAAFKVLFHVFRVCGPRERQHADLARESEDNLGRRRVELRGESCDQGMTKDFNICREQRKALVDDVALAAESAHVAVPSATGITAVLDKRRRFRVGLGHLPQLSD